MYVQAAGTQTKLVALTEREGDVVSRQIQIQIHLCKSSWHTDQTCGINRQTNREEEVVSRQTGGTRIVAECQIILQLCAQSSKQAAHVREAQIRVLLRDGRPK